MAYSPFGPAASGRWRGRFCLGKSKGNAPCDDQQFNEYARALTDNVMTTKDWIYLGLILLAGLAFYCNGFYAGVYQCKRMYDSLSEDKEPFDKSALSIQPFATAGPGHRRRPWFRPMKRRRCGPSQR